jgi:hypothetical protein
MLSIPHSAGAAIKTASIGVSAIVVDTCNIAVSEATVTGSSRCMKATPYRVVTSSASTDANAISAEMGGADVSSHHVKAQNAETNVKVMTFIF